MIHHIPIIPVPFARPRFNNGQGFNAPKYAAFKTELAWRLRSLVRRPPLIGALQLTVSFTLAPPKRLKNKHPISHPDVDNLLKAFLDAGNGILWNDDCQVVRIMCEKKYEPSPGIHFELITVTE